jgi:SSS family solute:Na+ symporter
VRAGRLATVITLVLGCGLGLALTDAGQAFMYILLLGAGTGAIYILRWFWWRINAVTEIVAMIVSLIVATFFTFVFPNYVPENPSIWWQLAGGIVPVLITTAAWVITAFMTKPTDQAALNKFCKIVKPGGPGWADVRLKAERDGIDLEGNQGEHWEVPSAILCAVWGCLAIYSSIFATGYWIYGRTGSAILFTVSTIVFAILLFLGWRKIQTDNVKQYVSALEDNEPT